MACCPRRVKFFEFSPFPGGPNAQQINSILKAHPEWFLHILSTTFFDENGINRTGFCIARDANPGDPE